MRKVILFFSICILSACSQVSSEEKLSTYTEVVTYDGLGEASNFYSYAFEGVDRNKRYHYFTKILSESAQLQLFILEESLQGNLKLTRGDEAKIKVKGKSIDGVPGLQVIILKKVISIKPQ